ncbi:band 7 protein AAEL010189, partial [Eurytemora carolleeae]|uniref:band 7 protein AAEL010189 n=1 Tax=Eurytemora carolleeae TaxID=1294199 RepID=UPI000C7858AE
MYPPPIEHELSLELREKMVRTNSVGSIIQSTPGGPAFKKNYGTAYDDDSDENGLCAFIITFLSYVLIFLTLPFTIWGCIKVVQEYERAVIFRLGRLKSGGAKGPGLFFIIPCIDTYRCVDLRTGAFDVPPQEILTKDSVTVSVDAVVYYQVSNPLSAICNNDDYNRSTRLLAATTLRNVLGTRNLSEILSDRETIGTSMHKTLEAATDPWGVHVERVEIKD